jgi:hypothetical protein
VIPCLQLIYKFRIQLICFFSIIIQEPLNPCIDPSAWSLTSYSSSTVITRYFCSTCGAHVLRKDHRDGSWAVTTGHWDKTEGIIEWTGCKYVEETLDGGVSVWLHDIISPEGGKRSLKRWELQDGKEGVLIPPRRKLIAPSVSDDERESLEGDADAEDVLKAHCHCRGVTFQITRPDETSKKAYSPYSDLIIPFHTGTSTENPMCESWFLRSNDRKYLAGLCVCTSCRQNSGYEFQPWAFISRNNILQPSGTSQSGSDSGRVEGLNKELDYKFGTLKRYNSAPGVFREFCKVCGATVFWHCDWRPEVVDVSVGLLDGVGSRCEGWLDWWKGRVSFAELGISKSLLGAMEEGMKLDLEGGSNESTEK